MSDQSTSAPAQHDVQAINTVNDTGFNTALGLEFVELGPISPGPGGRSPPRSTSPTASCTAGCTAR